MTAFICETAGHHEECLPSIVATLNSLGIASRTFQNSQALSLKGNIFACYAETEEYAPTPIPPTRAGIAMLEESVRSGAYSFAYINSLTSQVSSFWAKQPLPVLGVCHNIKRLGAANALAFLAGHPLSKLVVLGDHVKLHLLESIPSLSPDRVLVHYCAGQLTNSPTTKQNDPTNLRVVVPGRINFANRALHALASAIPKRARRTFNVELVFPGGISPEDRPLFRRLFTLQDAVTIEAPEYQRDNLEGRHNFFSATHEHYYSLIKNSSLMLPLIKSGDTRYLTSSITSTIPLSLNAGIPLLMEERHAQVYNIPAVFLDGSRYRQLIRRLDQGEFEAQLSATQGALVLALRKARADNAQTLSHYVSSLSSAN
jgi:hypothetical protein